MHSKVTVKFVAPEPPLCDSWLAGRLLLNLTLFLRKAGPEALSEDCFGPIPLPLDEAVLLLRSACKTFSLLYLFSSTGKQFSSQSCKPFSMNSDGALSHRVA